MKVLYLDHPEGDFLAAVVYLGLCQELGAENVVDWPWQPAYHGQVYRGPIPYPPPNDTGTCAPYPWMPAHPGRPWSDDEVFTRIAEFDLVVLASPRAYNTAALERLLARVGRGALRRLVMLDGEDYTTIRWDYADRFKFDRYFKTCLVREPFEVYHELKKRLQGTIEVRGFPFATPLGDIAHADKTVDVCFLGGGNWSGPRREGVPAGPRLKEALDAHLRSRFTSYVGGMLPHAEYIAAVNRSKVAVAVGGSGLEPMRTYEILSCPGTLLVRERIDVMSPFPLVEGVTHVGFDSLDWDGLSSTIQKYLDDEPSRLRVAEGGNAFLKAHYTPRARARQLLEEAF